MAVLTVRQIYRTGIDPVLIAAAAGGDAVPNAGRVFLRADNAHATLARTVNAASQLPAGAIAQGATKTDLAVSVPALGERWIGPFDSAGFNDANGRVVLR